MQASFVGDEVNNIIKDSIDSVLLNASYEHQKVSSRPRVHFPEVSSCLFIGTPVLVHFRRPGAAVLAGGAVDVVDCRGCAVEAGIPTKTLQIHRCAPSLRLAAPLSGVEPIC